MKRALLFLLSVSLSIGLASAQSTSGTAVFKSTPAHVPTDTVVNTAVKTQTLAISAVNNRVSVQVDLTKISGTAGGVVRLFASNTGVKYVRIVPTDSLTMTDVATKSKIFVITEPIYSYYQVQYTGAGTMSVKLNSQAVWRKEH